MNEITKQWVNAGLIVSKDKDAIILCPECTVGILIVKDESIPSASNKIDRYLVCNTCEKWNVITLITI